MCEDIVEEGILEAHGSSCGAMAAAAMGLEDELESLNVERRYFEATVVLFLLVGLGRPGAPDLWTPA